MAIAIIEREDMENSRKENKSPSESSIKMSLGGYKKNVLRGR